jgi:hypothetical protein
MPVGRALVLVFVASLAALLLPAPAAADPVAYRPPVPGPVIDPYRPPGNPYGPGNRGIDYATTPGEPVGAAADGEVTFAGSVAGGLHVVVLHADGIRTSLSFLAAVLVRRGQQVAAGQPVGRAASSLHFGARRGEAYLDPATLLAAGSSGGRAVLVPEGPGRPLGAVEEAAGLRRLLASDPTAARASRPPPPAPDGAGRSGPPVPAGLRGAVVGTPPAGAALLAAAALRTRRRRRRARPPLLADGRW